MSMSLAMFSSLLAILACKDSPMNATAIPSGVYAAPGGEEFVNVSSEHMRFHIVLSGQYAGQVLDREYKYRVLKSGQVQLYPVRDADAVFGIGQYRWFWTGEALDQRDGSGDVPLQTFVLTTP